MYELLLEFTQLCNIAEMPPERLIRHLVGADYRHRPALGRILAEHEHAARAELKETPDEVYEAVAKHLRGGEPMTVVRPNVLSLGRILSSQEAVDGLLDIAEEYVVTLFANHAARELALTYLREVLSNRIVVLPSGRAGEPVTFWSRFD